MSKYAVVDDVDGIHYWIAVDNDRQTIGCDDIGGQFTKAEAHIIAWALNAIAEGRLLYRDDGNNTDWALYGGPTEGVAPR